MPRVGKSMDRKATRRRAWLTDESWKRVYEIRLRSKRGQTVSPTELALCSRAMEQDPERYKKTSADVFNATVPFGSNAKAKRS